MTETSTSTNPKMSRLTRDERFVAAKMSELRRKTRLSVVYARAPEMAKGKAASARKKTSASAQRKVDARIIGT